MAKSVILLKYVDEGELTPDVFAITDTPAPEDCADGECIVRLLYVSADPYMRGRIRTSSPGYISNFELNQPITGFVTAEVTVSKHANYPVGTLLGALLPYVTVQVVQGDALAGAWKLNEYCTKETCSLGIGVLGMPGMTAYFGLDRVLRPKEGQTIFVNAAAGAVGNLVGQLAKLRGCRVVGSAGGPGKVTTCLKNGFDACVDYKAHPDADAFGAKLQEVCPSGIDMFFENVGGYQWDAVMPHLTKGSRVAICGCIDTYNNLSKRYDNYFSIGWTLVKSITIRGFLVFEWMGLEEERKTALSYLSEMHKKGKLVADETILEGIERIPDALIGLFTGLNTGKMVVRV